VTIFTASLTFVCMATPKTFIV